MRGEELRCLSEEIDSERVLTCEHGERRKKRREERKREGRKVANKC